ncbi:hypothetical protein Syun_004225 [Stephania yunnanensis]|uniref:Uncharacterized protein n=1 Tax=Stephania yunnanensis TaxID=152371 RepID=A0AAP0L407_9MAGN
MRWRRRPTVAGLQRRRQWRPIGSLKMSFSAPDSHFLSLAQVHGRSSATGAFAIQLAKFRGARVFATAAGLVGPHVSIKAGSVLRLDHAAIKSENRTSITIHYFSGFGGGDGAGVGVGVACLAEQVGIVVLNNSTTSVLENINI